LVSYIVGITAMPYRIISNCSCCGTYRYAFDRETLYIY